MTGSLNEKVVGMTFLFFNLMCIAAGSHHGFVYWVALSVSCKDLFREGEVQITSSEEPQKNKWLVRLCRSGC